MFSWNKPKEENKIVNSEEYSYLLKRYAELAARVDYLEANEDNLRNLARKIQKGRPVKQEEPETEDSNTRNVLIPV